MQIVDLSFGPPRRRTTRVRVGEGVIDLLVRDLTADPPGRLFLVISDDMVGPLYAEPLVRRLRRAGLRAELLIFPHGEKSKNRRTKERLENGMLSAGAGRDSAVVAVGGGVTGDLAGFTASTWHRGVPLIHVPTSLLSMADSSVGGKTAVNLPEGKNLVGSFHQPWGVYADVGTLGTLAESHYVAGLAEVVKSAIIGDAGFFRTLEGSVEPLLARDPETLIDVLSACVRIKGRVVTRDEKESGRRAVLNFGHTVGHAVETVTRHRVTHGRAVSMGMVVESHLAQRETGLPASHAARIRDLLASFGLPVWLPRRISVREVIQATSLDKKARGGQARYALPRRIGTMLPAPHFTVPVPEDSLRVALEGPLD